MGQGYDRISDEGDNDTDDDCYDCFRKRNTGDRALVAQAFPDYGPQQNFHWHEGFKLTIGT